MQNMNKEIRDEKEPKTVTKRDPDSKVMTARLTYFTTKERVYGIGKIILEIPSFKAHLPNSWAIELANLNTYTKEQKTKSLQSQNIM